MMFFGARPIYWPYKGLNLLRTRHHRRLMITLNFVLLTSLSLSTAVQASVIPLPGGYHRYSARNNNLEWKNCSVDLPGRECTRFEVPLDWHNDAAGKASLAVIRYPATKQPKLGTLFMNPGGPGGSGVETVQGPDGILSCNMPGETMTSSAGILVAWGRLSRARPVLRQKPKRIPSGMALLSEQDMGWKLEAILLLKLNWTPSMES
ncbi:unnamed protein product [Rhizoctonia solani]|uniref:Uncharacterized protein n=1 Tax=Rhizoctonia solani TaxID=456999 RepID=A0A8H3BV53_9AGAM|nr:unnamed protein product [Rhizoctonia solani]